MQFHVLDIIKGTTVDGPGFRTSIYLSGCSHRCKGCHNPQSWNPDGGDLISLEDLLEIVREEDFDVTLTGGDPLYNPGKCKILIEALKKEGRNVWVYTGFRWEDIISDASLLSAVRNADILVDGEFIESLKDESLRFKGSSNQRIIKVSASLQSGSLVYYEKDISVF